MQARLKNPATIVPDAMKAFQTVGALLEKTDIPKRTLGLIHLRTSQINGCAVCIDLHRRHSKGDETEERLWAVSAWREAPFFTDAERAVLALTEAVTRMADREDPVPDEVWNEAAKHYNERGMATLVIAITIANMWNRINVATKQIAGPQSWEK